MNKIDLDQGITVKAKEWQWCQLITNSCKDGRKYIHHSQNHIYELKSEKNGRMSSSAVLAKLSSLILPSTDKDFALEACTQLKNRVKSKYYSGICGFLRRILSIAFSRFSFEASAKGQEFAAVEAKIQAIPTRAIPRKPKPQPKQMGEIPTTNSSSDMVMNLLGNLLNQDDTSTAHTVFAPKPREKSIEISKPKEHALFTTESKEELVGFAKQRGLQEGDEKHYPAFEAYLNALVKESKQEIDPVFFLYASNPFLKFISCWKAIESLYTVNNLEKILKLESIVPQAFRPDHEFLLQGMVKK